MIRALCYACILLCSSQVAYASCNIQIDGDIEVSPEVIRISTAERSMVISQGQTLFVDYMPVHLSADQQALLERYAMEIRRTVPAVIAMALEGAEIGLRALNEVLHGMFEGEPPPDVMQAFDDLHNAIDQSVRQVGDEFYLARGQTSTLDKSLEGVGPVIERAVAASIGSMFSNIGDLFTQGEGSLDLKIGDMAERIGQMSARVEASVADHATLLERRAAGLCDDMQGLVEAESDLFESVPELEQFRLVRSI